MKVKSENIKLKPPYLLGLLCLIPLVGAFVGLGLFLCSLIKYKDKWLSIIGVAGIIWTIIFYSFLYYSIGNNSTFKNGFKQLSQNQLNSLIESIEYYNLIHGNYPDSLIQLKNDKKLIPIYDVAQGLKGKDNTLYNYEKMGNNYILFSSGIDGIPKNSDDIFPQISETIKSKIGLVIRR
jgi:hypothetical protein